MKRIAFFIVLAAGTLSAQSPAQNESVRKRLADLEYDLKSYRIPQSASGGCSIPLLKVPTPQGHNFAAKNVPAKLKVDPKIVVPSPLPACKK